jgi:hypothetical protein
MKIFYDAHAHKLEDQTGGFLIALEHELVHSVPDNKEILKLQNKEKLLFAVEYINSSFNETSTEVVKYHPQREGYLPDQVVADIKKRNPKLCIIDTLGEPFWSAKDYWMLVKKLNNIQILLAHCGGWDIANFLRIAVLEPNVWIDFSWTQEYFGWCGTTPEYKPVIDTINFGYLHKRTKNKILFGSDNPFYSQALALEKVSQINNAEDILVNNYLTLLSKAKII